MCKGSKSKKDEGFESGVGEHMVLGVGTGRLHRSES